MSARILQFPSSTEKLVATSNFGGCPTCDGSDGYFNIGRDHWFYCHAHRVRWCVGSNIFSGWIDESAEEQRAKYRTIIGYAVVSPTDPEAA